MTVSDDVVARLKQPAEHWKAVPMTVRLRLVRRFRRLLRSRWRMLSSLFPARPAIETWTAELLPLLAACRFLERNAEKVLRARTAGMWGRPLWLPGVTSHVERRPYGAVLILAPGNYPLMLPGIQLLQALVAGNVVALKPALGGEAAARLLVDLLAQAGFPQSVCMVLPTDSGAEAVAAGFDLIMLTGSVQTGRQVLEGATRTLTPTIMELSGVDPVFVLRGADLGYVARRLAYGIRLNNGATCIAPHRVFVRHEDKAEFLALLRSTLAQKPPLSCDSAGQARLAALVEQIEASGGRAETIGGVTLFTEVEGLSDRLDTDIFVPWLAVTGVSDMEEALMLDTGMSYALGASIFGPVPEATRMARRIRSGSICINDLIVPTADPRLPFGGAGASGYGVTRGPEGLLALTRPVVTSVRSDQVIKASGFIARVARRVTKSRYLQSLDGRI
ncbi:aldehyde dehydrogenase family protein [Gluconobacter sp. Dm-44]|uniref:aldehyde dehydrogenase family protein n=1 Tax=Gluconobacter sp. Dm-44 TaxID=2799805 RepID=UPI001B8D93A4|nr:aldehyde dehydrogenase family protein [Gluconobacter sp. Dm-44]MBS1060398.1 aldehyde dehydrogenase family protein [Gluconobacter sp. Dm-44]